MVHAFLASGASWWLVVALLIALNLVRYLLFAGGALAAVTVFRNRLARRRIQPRDFTRRQLRREFLFSLSSMVVFAGFALFSATVARPMGVSHVYLDWDAYGWPWLALSVPAVILFHDTYFYWMHRLMHVPGVFERVHHIHHRSTNPSPLAVLAFHPLEALIEGAVVLLATIIMPIHVAVLAIWATYMLATNVMGHLGYELLPRSLARHPVFGWLNTATSHNQHHQRYNGNYGLYTLLWDRLMGTLHPGYPELFDRVTDRSGAPSPIPRINKAIR